ncbi:hypothetical protein [Clostridium brassicae]|uniref:ImmA/IrrE family metallo-endopeptidase n=1 Tax=Clostridium brassicae TaxID=2999072 RepID=A0ABT4DAX2_9CLOT|nr:hypothetical protein [Clostridium brassicae]MCY6958276.1 hypothetical protein [Clostridium brassicae]
MSIPNKIKLGWRNYKIKYEDNPTDSEGDLLCGDIDYINEIIRLNKNIPLQTQELTLIHELFHGIFNAMGRNDLSVDENLIDGISERLYEIIKDNPQLFK